MGGGPAGMMLGLVLARAGVRTLVLEKHGDFLRDFRGDTIHPSTMEVMHELGLLEAFLRLPHQKVQRFNAQFGDSLFPLADFAKLPVQAPYIAMMPQWDFLNFLAAQGARYPTFTLRMEAEAEALIVGDGRVAGVRVGAEEIHADLVVGADGRRSVLRAQSGLALDDLGAPMDVFWFRLSRRPGDTEETIGRFDRGAVLVMLNRGDYWQCAYLIPKGHADRVRAEGVEKFRAIIARRAPFVADRVDEIRTVDDMRLLTVTVDRLRTWWRPGLVFIGDAAHAMSPLGGIGINLAIQDAVAAANILAAPLREGTLTDADLAAVQARRERPTRITQQVQVFLHRAHAGGRRRERVARALAAAGHGDSSVVAATAGPGDGAGHPARACDRARSGQRGSGAPHAGSVSPRGRSVASSPHAPRNCVASRLRASFRLAPASEAPARLAPRRSACVKSAPSRRA